MKREDFRQVVAQALDTLPEQFRERIQNVAVLVEDYPEEQRERQRPRGAPRRLPAPRF